MVSSASLPADGVSGENRRYLGGRKTVSFR